MIGIGLNIGNRVIASFDYDASAFFAATGITGATEQQAVNTLVTSLKSAGLWSKMKAVYPFVTDNSNLLSYTEDFGNAYWNNSGATIYANTTTTPNGTTTADSLVENTANSFKYVINSGGVSSISGTTYTASIYAKSSNRYLQITFNSTTHTFNQYANFDLINGTLGTYIGGTPTITSVGNGWYRCSFTSTANVTTSGNNQIFYAIENSASANRANGYTGDGTSTLYIWGAQLEIGSTATTYQPIATTQQSYISNQFKYNLVNPVDSDSAFRGVFNGGWTFSNQGATPNGTNGYMDTKFVPNTNLTINDQSYSIYSRSNTAAGAKRELALSSSGEVGVLARYTGDLFYPIIGGGVYPNVSNTDSRGHYIANRTDATNIKGYKNGSLVLTYPQTPNLPTLFTVALSAKNSSGTLSEYSDRQLAFSHLGQGLTDTEATALYNAVNQFQVTLNRAV